MAASLPTQGRQALATSKTGDVKRYRAKYAFGVMLDGEQITIAQGEIVREGHPVLEGRMDGEFDSVGRQMEALGTLLAQVIDAVHRVELQIVGEQPASERMRGAAQTVLESLRANVRQRSRRAGSPPQLGSGR